MENNWIIGHTTKMTTIYLYLLDIQTILVSQ